MKTTTRIAALAAVAIITFGFNQYCHSEDSLADAIKAVQAVGENGSGHEAAAKAMLTLNSQSPDKIPMLLDGMQGASPIALNWFRGAVESILRQGGELPRTEIQAYFDDSSKSAMGRLLAFELLTEGKPELEKEMTPKLIDDPSLPLRAKAIASYIESAKEAEPQQAIGILGIALGQARDLQQIDEIAEQLEKHGVTVNMQQHLGFLKDWHVVGCFDNKDEKGFDVAYGPELAPTEIDVEKNTFTDCEGKEVKWESETTSDSTGVVDLVELIGPIKGVTAYAVTTFKAVEDIEVDLRIGCINAHKVWVNGELVMTNEVYHNGISPDKFSCRTKLKQGPNEILVKVCQNEQKESWAQQWRFQLRICDETGKAIAPAKPAPAQY